MTSQLNFDQYIIGPICIQDAEDFWSFVSNNRATVENTAPVTARMVKDLESTIKFINERLLKAGNKELFSMLVKDTTNGRVIASIVLTNIDLSVPKGEFGYYIDKNYEGKGITTKALSILCDHYFYELGFNKLFMRISESNHRSKRVAEKNGFMIEGFLKSDYRNFKDELEDKFYYGKVKPLLTPDKNKVLHKK